MRCNWKLKIEVEAGDELQASVAHPRASRVREKAHTREGGNLLSWLERSVLVLRSRGPLLSVQVVFSQSLRGIMVRVVPLSEALGVQLLDFDIKASYGPAEQAELRDLFCAHHLLLVRDQAVTAADQTRFVGYFGPLHTRADGMKETYVANVTEAGEPTARTGTARLIWHQDGTYGLRPGIATSLWAQEVAPDSVPTLYANAVRALERMPADLRARTEPLHAVHLRDTQEERTDYRWREDSVPADAQPGRFLRHEHPIVYQMPHTDQKTLLVNELMTSHVAGLPRAEGEALLQQLFSLIYATDNVYTHHWQTDDVLIWDNFALHHCRPAEMGLPVRRLRRQSLDGWYTDRGLLDWQETVVAYAGYSQTADP
jgi:taurine dioxygenase